MHCSKCMAKKHVATGLRMNFEIILFLISHFSLKYMHVTSMQILKNSTQRFFLSFFLSFLVKKERKNLFVNMHIYTIRNEKCNNKIICHLRNMKMFSTPINVEWRGLKIAKIPQRQTNKA
jgi:hypothetical protein